MKVVEGMPADEYHAVDALSSTFLREMLRSPAHAKWSKENRTETQAMYLGTALHTRCLEPDRFKSKYFILPDVDRRTKIGKEATAAAIAAAPEGALGLEVEQMDACSKMDCSVFRHPVAIELFKLKGRHEISIFWDHNGVQCKARIDRVAPVNLGGVLFTCAMDIKTTSDAGPRPFMRSAFDLGYHIQQSWYEIALLAAGIHIDRFVFVAVENTAPHACAVYELDSCAEEIAVSAINKHFAAYKKCKKDDVWPAYSDNIETLFPPAWMLASEVVN